MATESESNDAKGDLEPFESDSGTDKPQKSQKDRQDAEGGRAQGGQEDDGEDEEGDDDDEEPRLKYARVTSSLGSLYRNGDATSTFLAAGDKMVSYCIRVKDRR